MTGIKKTRDMKREQEAAMRRYKNICILDVLLSLLWSMMAVVEVFRDYKTLFRQF
jgi:hypothetical protein